MSETEQPRQFNVPFSWWESAFARLREAGDVAEGVVRTDLRYLEENHRMWRDSRGAVGGRFPGRRALAARWGWSERRVRDILARDDWHTPVNPIPWSELKHAGCGDEPEEPDDDGLFELPGPMTHAEVVQRAVRWLRGHHECRTVFAEIVTYERVNPDAIGFRKVAGSSRAWSVLVEAKISRSDFRADRDKIIHRLPDSCPGQERWYLTPPGLVRAEEVPPGWGLAECGKRSVRIVVPAPKGEPVMERAHADMGIMLAALRRHAFGVRWFDDTARFEPYSAAGKGDE